MDSRYNLGKDTVPADPVAPAPVPMDPRGGVGPCDWSDDLDPWDPCGVPVDHPAPGSEHEPDIPVPADALEAPLDEEFRNIGLTVPPPDPFDTEASRRERVGQVRLEPHVPMPFPDIALVRRRLRLTQRQFAHIFGFPLATLRHWEKGDRHPTGAALVLLNVIARHPRAVLTSVARYRMARITVSPGRR